MNEEAGYYDDGGNKCCTCPDCEIRSCLLVHFTKFTKINLPVHYRELFTCISA